MTLTPTLDQIRADWESVATSFDTHTTPRSMEWGRNALRHVDIGPGRSLLDVGAGSGGLSIPAAMTGTNVTAVDISPTMIKLLGERASSIGLDIDTHVMNGTDLSLDDDMFDVVASLNGVSTFPDAAAGLTEMSRVTRPGGQVQVVAFGAMGKAEWLGIFLGVLSEVVDGFSGLPANGPPSPFQFADREVLRQRLMDAGLSEIRVISEQAEMDIGTGQNFWNLFVSSNPIGSQIVAPLDDGQRSSVIEGLDGEVRERKGILTTELNIGVGGKR